MRNTAVKMYRGIFVLFLLGACQAFPSEADTQIKAKWKRELESARSVLLSSNDRETAEFVGRMLVSLERSDGAAPAALAANRERMKQFARELIRKGALESAVVLKNTNFKLTRVRASEIPDAPARAPRAVKVGSPGPGGLVLYMPFDAPPTNGVVRDESGTGNDGWAEGAQWIPKGGYTGGAYRFSITNVDDRIVVPDSDTLGAQYVTLSAWVLSSRVSGLPGKILDKDRRKGYSLGLGQKNNSNRGLLEFSISWDTGALSSRGVCDGRWHHVAGTYDGQICRLYVDGAMVMQRSTPVPGPIPRNHWDLCIGNSVVEYEGGTFSSFDGLIDEVRVYNRALSAAEIQALASATKASAILSSVSSSSDGSASRQTAAERIKQAKELLDQGILSKEDYDKKVKDIVDAL